MTMPANIPALAVIVVRDGELPAGADETVAEAGGAALVLGSGTRQAASLLDAASRVWLLERILGRPWHLGRRAGAGPGGRAHGAAARLTRWP